jgi:tetraacyldisaccharide 4'-kinase
MARLLDEIPVLVGRDRLKAAGLAVSRFKPDVILLDDGFQYRRLARDLDILLLDCGAPLGNGYLLPRGILREPPQAILRADAVVMTRCRRRKPAIQERIRRLVRSDALFRSVHRPLVRWTVPAMQPVGRHPGLQEKDGAAAPLKDRRIYAFSALAGNRSFFDSLAHLGAAPLESRGFPDHHAWSPAEIRGIATAARAAGCDCLVTTEKDFVRLPEETVLPLDLVVAGVDIDFGDDTGRWLRFISRRVLGDLSADGRCHE